MRTHPAIRRKLVTAKHTYPDDKIAVANLFMRWNVGLGQPLPERRMALRLSRPTGHGGCNAHYIDRHVVD